MGPGEVVRAVGRKVERELVGAVCGRGRASDNELRAAVSRKTVLITGASFGIGEATARRIAGCGGTVLLVARSAERLDRVRAEIEQAGGGAYAYPADLTDPAAVDALVTRLRAEHTHLDVLINNAGKSIRRSVELSQQRFSDFERTININYLGPVKLTLALLPWMREAGGAHVVNVSTWGMRMTPAPRWSAYSASKAAFDAWFRTFGQEVRASGITTSTAYMGLVHTRMSAPTGSLRNKPGLQPDEAAALLVDAIVHRKLKVEAPLMPPVAIAAAVLRTPFELIGAALYPYGDDTASAKAAVLNSVAATADPTHVAGSGKQN